jgi:hypothetical protein
VVASSAPDFKTIKRHVLELVAQRFKSGLLFEISLVIKKVAKRFTSGFKSV